MADSDCTTIQSYSQLCATSTPGVRNVYFGVLPTGYTQTNIEEIVTLDGTDLDIITDFTGTTGQVDLYKWEFTKDTASLTIEGQPDADGDVSSYKATVALNLKKMSAESRNKIQLLASNSRLVCVINDKNGVPHACGLQEGGRAVTVNGMTGLNAGEKNGYELSFEFVENVMPYVTLDSALASAIV